MARVFVVLVCVVVCIGSDHILGRHRPYGVAS
jgi:hypothetical protein